MRRVPSEALPMLRVPEKRFAEKQKCKEGGCNMKRIHTNCFSKGKQLRVDTSM
jgi:hypothetical protein